MPVDLAKFDLEARLVIDALENADSELGSPVGEEIPRVHRSIRLAIRLIGRVSDPTHELEVEEIDLGHSIGTILEMLEPYLQGIAVSLEIDDRARYLKTSEIDLLRIIGNLIKNAAEALRNSTKEKKIEIKVFADGEDKVGISVSDNGPGLPEEMRDDPFCSQVRSKRGKNHGFGLPSIKEETGLLHGEIQLADTSEAGTSFLLMLPCDPKRPLVYKRPEIKSDLDAVIRRIFHDVRNGLAGAQALATKMQGSDMNHKFSSNINLAMHHLDESTSGGGEKKSSLPMENSKLAFEKIAEILKDKHVILIDDNEVVREIANAFCAQGNPKSLKVTSLTREIEEALSVVPEDELENVILITDHMMPGMSGKDLASLIRKKYSTIKILLYSGSNEILEDIEDNPFNGSLKKPLKAVDFLKVLRNLFKQDQNPSKSSTSPATLTPLLSTG